MLTEDYIKQRWQEYIGQLYCDERKIKPIFKHAQGLKKEMKKKKVPEPDNITIEITPELINPIMDNGIIPENMGTKRSIIIPIQKKMQQQNNQSDQPSGKLLLKKLANDNKE